METEKILEVVEMYRKLLEGLGIGKERMSLDCTFQSLTREQRLSHAHYLLDGVVQYAQIPGKEGKTGRHLNSVQMILSFEGFYTLEQLMDHNRPDSRKSPNAS